MLPFVYSYSVTSNLCIVVNDLGDWHSMSLEAT